MPWQTGGLLDRRPRVDLPQSDRFLDRETVSFLQRRRHLRRAPACRSRSERAGGPASRTGASEQVRGSFQPQSPEAKVRATQIPRPPAKIRELGRRLPSRRQGRGLVPVAAQPSQDLVIEIEDRPVLPVTLGIIGTENRADAPRPPGRRPAGSSGESPRRSRCDASRARRRYALAPDHRVRPDPFDATIPRSSLAVRPAIPRGQGQTISTGS